MTDSPDFDQIADGYPDLDLLRTEAGRWAVARRVEWWRLDTRLSLMDEERQRLDKGLLGALGLLLGDPNPDYATDVTGAAWSWDAEDGRLPALVGLLTDTPPYGWVAGADQEEGGNFLDLIEETYQPGPVVQPPPHALAAYLLSQADRPAAAPDADPAAEPAEQTGLSTFVFETMTVRTVLVDGAPWFVATDVAKVLGYRDAANMVRNLDGEDAGTHNVSSRSENAVEQARKVTIINESGLYAAILASRRAEARRFKRWVTAEVLPALRAQGFYVAAATEPPAPPGRDVAHPAARLPADQRADPMFWLDVIKTAARVAGKTEARRMWAISNLPPLSADNTDIPSAEGDAALDHLLAAEADRGGTRIADLILAAEADSPGTARVLERHGLKLRRERQTVTALYLSSSAPGLRRVYAGTRWDNGHWRPVLRTIPEVRSGPVTKFMGTSSKTLLIPIDVVMAAVGELGAARPDLVPC